MNSITYEYLTNKKQINARCKEDIKRAKKEYSLEVKRLKRIKKEEKLKANEIKNENLNKYYQSAEFIALKNPPKRSVLEEIGNSITHGVGAFLSIFALIFLLIKSTLPVQTVSSIIYAGGMFIAFLSSTLYHAFKYGSKVKRLFRRFDYLSIYLLIGATFAPILLCYVQTKLSFIFFIAQWVIIATGITLVSVFGPQKIKAINFTLYFLIGWAGLIFIPELLVDLPFFLLILGGGVIYTLGIIPFAMDKKSAHFIWHFFVLLGAFTQFIGIYLYVF